MLVAAPEAVGGPSAALGWAEAAAGEVGHNLGPILTRAGGLYAHRRVLRVEAWVEVLQACCGEPKEGTEHLTLSVERHWRARCR